MRTQKKKCLISETTNKFISKKYYFNSIPFARAFFNTAEIPFLLIVFKAEADNLSVTHWFSSGTKKRFLIKLTLNVLFSLSLRVRNIVSYHRFLSCYTTNSRHCYMNYIFSIQNGLRKYGFYSNLKNYFIFL